MNKVMKGFIAAIAAMGVVRFALDQSGVSPDVVKYFSMTVVMMIGSLYFAIDSKTHKERLKAAYLLVMPYMIVEVLALSYTWFTGRPSIFHTEKTSMGYPLGTHLLGHLVGGFTWEPLFGFVVMEIVWFACVRSRTFFNREPSSAA